MRSNPLFRVAITAYERPQRLQRLLVQLAQQRDVHLDVHIYYDGPDPSQQIEATCEQKGTLHTTSQHMGREGYYRLFNETWIDARDKPWDHFLFIQDDMSTTDPTLLAETDLVMDDLSHDVRRIACLNLYGDGPNWAQLSRWTDRPVVQMMNGHLFAHWVDMQAVVFTREAVERIPSLHGIENEGASSGVGKELSQRFDMEGMAQVMVPEPALEHADGGRSKMHPEREGPVYPESRQRQRP